MFKKVTSIVCCSFEIADKSTKTLGMINYENLSNWTILLKQSQRKSSLECKWNKSIVLLRKIEPCSSTQFLMYRTIILPSLFCINNLAQICICRQHNFIRTALRHGFVLTIVYCRVLLGTPPLDSSKLEGEDDFFEHITHRPQFWTQLLIPRLPNISSWHTVFLIINLKRSDHWTF